jgi:glutamine amidotransferase
LRTPDVAVVDYGVGNLLSVQRAFEHCGANVAVTGDAQAILGARHVVLPGVGAFPVAIGQLRASGLDTIVRQAATAGIPVLGICLGMQMLLDESVEFTPTAGLGLIPGRVVPVPAVSASGEPQKIPHIGWSPLRPAAGVATWQNTLLAATSEGDAVYFVHSFMAPPRDAADWLAVTSYGDQPIPAVIARGNVLGCQFHPEKSGEAGLTVLRSFLAL